MSEDSGPRVDSIQNSDDSLADGSFEMFREVPPHEPRNGRTSTDRPEANHACHRRLRIPSLPHPRADSADCAFFCTLVLRHNGCRPVINWTTQATNANISNM